MGAKSASENIRRVLEAVKDTYGILLFLVITALLILSNYYWLMVDETPLGWDTANHFIDTVYVYNIILENPFNIVGIVNQNNYYPTLTAIIIAPFYYLFGVEGEVGILALDIVFLPILLFSTYGIGKKMLGEHAGLLAALLISVYPAVGIFSRFFFVDVPLAALAALSVYLLLKTDSFKNWKYSALLGVSLGLGMLIKWTFFIFMPAIILYYLASSFKFDRELLKANRGTLKNFLLAMVVGAIVASIWYLPNIGIFLELFKHAGIDTAESNYIVILTNGISLVLALVTIAAFAMLLKEKELRPCLIMLLLWIAVPFLVFSLQANRDIRFLLPVLPAFAVISGAGIASLKKTNIKLLAIVALVVVCLLVFYNYSYGSDIPGTKVKINPHLSVGGLSLGAFDSYQSHPVQGSWKEKEILNTVISDYDKDSVSITVIPSNPNLDGPISCYAYIKDKPKITYDSGSHDPFAIFYSNYIVTLKDKKGYWGPSDPRLIDEIAYYSQDLLDSNMEDYKEIKSFDLPDNSKAVIYKREYNTSMETVPEHLVNVNLSNQIQFIGYTIKPLHKNTSEDIRLFGREILVYEIDYYWKPLTRMDKNYIVYLHMNEVNGTSSINLDHKPFNGAYETSEWVPDTVIREKFVFRLSWAEKSGTYNLTTGVYDPVTVEVLPIENDGGTEIGLGNLTIVNLASERNAALPDYMKL